MIIYIVTTNTANGFVLDPQTEDQNMQETQVPQQDPRLESSFYGNVKGSSFDSFDTHVIKVENYEF